MSRVKDLWTKYRVVIVMIPSLIGLHWGWNELQKSGILMSTDSQQQEEGPFLPSVPPPALVMPPMPDFDKMKRDQK
ncbi:Hypp2666 [Branchiostoma lanceolatum]|uniref:Hypp2666 protein n=1 Tax=Branchiostoma lanceolatum TaxID=7740 RepID=A0A8J9ZTH9_BRALA|nr:Hypp2666 [Branchiostoma lanceolatum]